MSELKVSKDGKISFKINLSKNLFKIGRSLTSDLTLDDLEVSREHAEIIYRNENYYLKDKSLAGTKVNNQFVDEIILEDGAKIEIGRWQIEFNAYAKEDEAYLDDVKTTITQYQKKSETKIVGINQDQNSFLTEKIILLVKAPDKNTRRFILNEKSLTIGSSSEADIMVEDDYVSSLHARLTATNNGIEIKDLGSTNGVWINENKVGEISLTPPQIISLGQTKLSLFSEQENEEIEPLNVDQFCGLVGKSESMRKVYKQIKRVAPTLHTVLIQADTGCGKELVAKAIHDLSPNKSGPYYILNCGAISPNLIESELFGHEKGAFTGAINRHVGVFEKAYNGTVFLDEIGELPLDLQPKLLRVLENRTIRRVGSSEEIPVRARIIAATHRDLKSWVEKGKFRMDLYYRLCVLPIFISSLKERAEDIPLIATHLVNQMSPTPKKISSNTIDNFEELYEYCYRVASMVGLVCLKIFEADNKELIKPAIDLGLALQLTNIIRDVGVDTEKNRIYLPEEDLKKFKVSENAIFEKQYSKEFFEMMNFQYQRALDYYQTGLTPFKKSKLKNIIPATMMGEVYFKLLKKIRRNKFPVLHRRVKLNLAEKMSIFLKMMILK